MAGNSLFYAHSGYRLAENLSDKNGQTLPSPGVFLTPKPLATAVKSPQNRQLIGMLEVTPSRQSLG